MAERRRVDGQACYVLHAYPFRETSLILEVFSRSYGRIALMARGARRPRSSLRGLLMSFQPLELGWAGAGEVATLMKAEWVGGQPLLEQRALWVGYYINELLVNLLPREDGHERLYEAYETLLRQLAIEVREANLRRFEKTLLQELGYGLNLTHDRNDQAIRPELDYRYEIENGATPLRKGESAEIRVLGQTLLDIDSENFSNPLTTAQAKQLMRALMHYYLGGKVMETRKIFMELQDL